MQAFITPSQDLRVGARSSRAQYQYTLQGVDVVVHLAARVHVMHEQCQDPLAEFRRVNVQGTLALAQPTLADAATVSVSGTLHLDHASADTIGGFILNGSQMWKGSWGPVGSAARYQTPSLTGTGTLLVTAHQQWSQAKPAPHTQHPGARRSTELVSAERQQVDTAVGETDLVASDGLGGVDQQQCGMVGDPVDHRRHRLGGPHLVVRPLHRHQCRVVSERPGDGIRVDAARGVDVDHGEFVRAG
jgi:hypothetical protein